MGQKVPISRKFKNKELVFVSCNTRPIALARIVDKEILPFRIFNN